MPNRTTRSKRRPHRRTHLLVVAALLLLTACHPVYTGAQFRELQNRITYPRTRSIGKPAVRGHAAADARIRQVAERRGYRVRPAHVGARRAVAGVQLDIEAAAALAGLIADARAAGHVLWVTSGYRSPDHQRSLFTPRIGGLTNAAIVSGRVDGAISEALRWTAAPGYSKHQTGHTVDLSSPHGSKLAFATTPVGRWLAADNHRAAKNRGFVPSYPPGAGAQGPDPEPWEYTYVGRDAIRCGLWLARDGDRHSFDACRANSPIPTKYALLGGIRSKLGRTTRAESGIAGPRPGRAQRYERGLIVWSPTTGAHPLWGRLVRTFDRSGGTRGPLGHPITDIRKTPDGLANYTIFQHGRIYAVGVDANASYITKPFSDLHQAHGGVRGDLGHVSSSPKAVAGGTAQEFRRGRIYESASGRFATHGAIHERHRIAGGSRSAYGFPASKIRIRVDGGRAQVFAGGRIYLRPGAGVAFGVHTFLADYLASGGPEGPLGYPTAELGPATGGRRVQRFQHGRIVFDTASRTATIELDSPTPDPDETPSIPEESTTTTTTVVPTTEASNPTTSTTGAPTMTIAAPTSTTEPVGDAAAIP